jgi:hypothetical protein
MRRSKLTFVTVVSAMLVTGLSPVQGADFASPSDPSAGWLQTINYYRTASGLLPITENAAFTKGVLNHATYLAKTNPALMSGRFESRHSENPASPYATISGVTTGAGDLTSNSIPTESEPIDAWMTAPFHAVGLLRENLRTSGFGQAFNVNNGNYEQGVSVLSGLVRGPRTKNILFPGPNSKVRLNAFTGENPDPRESCGPDWQNYLGLPIWASLVSTPPSTVFAALTTPSGAVLTSSADLCVIDKFIFKTSDPIYGPVGKSIIESDNLVMIIPKNPLDGGMYQVKLSMPDRPVIAWSFGVIAPLPSQILLTFPTERSPNIYSWQAVSGTADNTVLGYQVILTNTIGRPPQLFNVTDTKFDASSLDPGDYSICVRANGSASNSACAWYSITKNPSLVPGVPPESLPSVSAGSLLDSRGVALSGSINNPTTVSWTLADPTTNDSRGIVVSLDLHLRLAGDSKDLTNTSLPPNKSNFTLPTLNDGNYSICLVAKNGYGESRCNLLGTFWVLKMQDQVLHFVYSSRNGKASKGSNVVISTDSSVASSDIVYTPNICSVSTVDWKIQLHDKKAGTCNIEFTNTGDSSFRPINKKFSLKFR